MNKQKSDNPNSLLLLVATILSSSRCISSEGFVAVPSGKLRTLSPCATHNHWQTFFFGQWSPIFQQVYSHPCCCSVWRQFPETRRQLTVNPLAWRKWLIREKKDDIFLILCRGTTILLSHPLTWQGTERLAQAVGITGWNGCYNKEANTGHHK